MITAPPDPAASHDAELRSEDDGMPEHPMKAADPVAWAETRVAREKDHAAGYPTHPIGQAWTDLTHSVSRLADRVRPARPVVTASTVIALGAGLAIYYLFLRHGRHRYR